eukprot:4052690-Karenia_brevis.AAC.1
MGPEITAKVSVLRSVLKPLQPKFLTNPKVAISRRKLVCKAIVISRATHHAGTWPDLTTNELRRFHGAVMQAWRTTTGSCWRDGQVSSNAEVLSDNCLPAPRI